MALLELTIRIASPLLVGQPRQGNILQSYGHIPGAVIQGAVAQTLMADWSFAEQQRAHPEDCQDPATCPFCRVISPIGGEPPFFFDAYPGVTGSEVVYPFPQSARTCKRYPGFKKADDIDERHGIFDTLIAQAAAAEALAQNKPLHYIYTAVCPECGEPLQPPREESYGRIDQTYYTAHPINKRFSRTAINRRRHTAASGLLYTLDVAGEVMATDLPKRKKVATEFRGYVQSGAADLDLLKDALRSIHRLGSGSSRGLGQVGEVVVTEVATTSVPDGELAQFQSQLAQDKFNKPPTNLTVGGLLHRIWQFNTAVAGERDFYHRMGIEILPASWYFTIDLLAHTFVQQYGLPTLNLSADMLQLDEAAQIIRVTEPVDKGGWSGAWGLPRPRQVGLASGSTFMFAVENKSPEVTKQLIKRLAELENAGIGDDRPRGAGRLLACAPFHQEVNPI